jgi:hypothetical protein
MAVHGGGEQGADPKTHPIEVEMKVADSTSNSGGTDPGGRGPGDAAVDAIVDELGLEVVLPFAPVIPDLWLPEEHATVMHSTATEAATPILLRNHFTVVRSDRQRLFLWSLVRSRNAARSPSATIPTRRSGLIRGATDSRRPPLTGAALVGAARLDAGVDGAGRTVTGAALGTGAAGASGETGAPSTATSEVAPLLMTGGVGESRTLPPSVVAMRKGRPTTTSAPPSSMAIRLMKSNGLTGKPVPARELVRELVLARAPVLVAELCPAAVPPAPVTAPVPLLGAETFPDPETLPDPVTALVVGVVALGATVTNGSVVDVVAAVVGATVLAGEVPVIDVLAVSVTVTVWVPGVFKVMSKRWSP